MLRRQILHPASVTALAWSPENTRLVTGAASQVTFFNADTGLVLAHSRHHHSAAIASLAWTGQSQAQIVSGSLDRRAIVWSSSDYHAQTIFALHTAPITSVAWSPDGRTIASASLGGVVRVWGADGGREVHPFYQDAQRPMRAAAFAPTGTMLAVGGDDGVLRLWRNGLICQMANSTKEPFCQDRPTRFASAHGPLSALAWSPDGRFLACGFADGALVIWEPAQRLTPVLTSTAAAPVPILDLSWAPTGDALAMAAGTSITIWKFGAS